MFFSLSFIWWGGGKLLLTMCFLLCNVLPSHFAICICLKMSIQMCQHCVNSAVNGHIVMIIFNTSEYITKRRSSFIMVIFTIPLLSLKSNVIQVANNVPLNMFYICQNVSAMKRICYRERKLNPLLISQRIGVWQYRMAYQITSHRFNIQELWKIHPCI